jgi:hypothetical protein
MPMRFTPEDIRRQLEGAAPGGLGGPGQGSFLRLVAVYGGMIAAART